MLCGVPFTNMRHLDLVGVSASNPIVSEGDATCSTAHGRVMHDGDLDLTSDSGKAWEDSAAAIGEAPSDAQEMRRQDSRQCNNTKMESSFDVRAVDPSTPALRTRPFAAVSRSFASKSYVRSTEAGGAKRAPQRS